ncbi:MAG: hypothetical protein LC105_04175 [Chitinophagales bacterium]|nr:hypothetical protein [Chitinophagales bacterium]
MQKIDFDSLRKILFYFVKKGLIEPTDIRRSQPNFYIYVNVEAYDLFNHNGFTGIEFLLEENLRKLQLELKELQSTLPEKVNTISEIVTAITSILTLWVNR